MQQQAARQLQAGVDVVAAIKVGIIDQPLPAHGGAGFLEIHPHHHLQLIAVVVTLLSDRRRVLLGSLHIVHRAGAHDHQ